MKKYILHILLLSLLIIPRGIWADECSQSCNISDAPAPVLTEYFTNLEIIRSNILSQLSEAQNAESEVTDSFSAKDDAKKTISASKNFLRSITSILSFNDYFGSFDYKISLPITNEVPSEVKRDHAKLEKESDALTYILQTSQRRKTSQSTLVDICWWVSHCSISNSSAEDIILKLIANNRNILRFYESSILDKWHLSTQRDFILTSPDFESQIEQYYNKDTLASCSRCEGNTWSSVSETIQNISIKNSDYKEWMQKWKDAWAQLRWGEKSQTSAAQESRILSDYLWTQWISWSQAGIVLDNLNRYWSEWVSGSNPLFNSSFYAQAGVENGIDNFSQALSEKLEWEEKVPIVELSVVNSEIKGSENLKNEIASLYQDQLPFAQSQDQASQELQLRILRSHFSLVRSINMLQKSKRTSEQLCDKQGKWLGKCSYD